MFYLYFFFLWQQLWHIVLNDWRLILKRHLFFNAYFYTFVLSHASEVSLACEAICCVCVIVLLLRGVEVLRAADRLHKSLLLHKREHVLSNCQNVYVKDCGRPAVWGSPSPLCLRWWCISVCVTDFMLECARLPVCVCLCSSWVHLHLSVCMICLFCFFFYKPCTLIHFTEVCSSYAERQ